jgi:hypothetical protein
VPVAFVLGVLAALWIYLARDPQAFGVADVSAPTLWPGIVMAECAFAILVVAHLSLLRRVQALVLTLVVVLTTVFIGANGVFGPGLDLRPMAQRLKSLEAQGTPVAHLGKYHGQFQFLGRLNRPIASVGEDELAAWLIEHPHGYVIGPVFGAEFTRLDAELRTAASAPLSPGLAAEFVQPHRRGGIYLARLDADTAALAPERRAAALRRIRPPSAQKPEPMIARKAVERWRTAD